MAETYRFDPDLVVAEMDAAVARCETNGLVPADVPTNAKVTIDGPWLKVEHYIRGERGLVLNADRSDVLRTTRVVPLIARPELASLKPVEPEGSDL